MIVGSIAMATAILLAFLRVPLAFSLLAVSVTGIGFAINWNIALQLLPLTISDAVLSYDLAVVPMFILMGNVISKTGIAHDLFRAAYAFVGNVRGGLALSTMVACSGFSAVCGSSYATAATMAKVAYPSMKKYTYAYMSLTRLGARPNIFSSSCVMYRRENLFSSIEPKGPSRCTSNAESGLLILALPVHRFLAT